MICFIKLWNPSLKKGLSKDESVLLLSVYLTILIIYVIGLLVRKKAKLFFIRYTVKARQALVNKSCSCFWKKKFILLSISQKKEKDSNFSNLFFNWFGKYFIAVIYIHVLETRLAATLRKLYFGSFQTETKILITSYCSFARPAQSGSMRLLGPPVWVRSSKYTQSPISKLRMIP